MTKEDVVKRVTHNLSGGNEIRLEVDPQAIEDFICDAVTRVRDWYLEPPIVQTVDVVLTQGNKTIPYNKLAYVPKIVDKIYDIEPIYTSPLDHEARLMALSQGIFESTRVTEWAIFNQYLEMLNTTTASDIAFIDLKRESVILISGVTQSVKLSVKYNPDISSVADITVNRAIAWVLDWTEAKTKHALARVRGKFRSGDLNVETDADSLASEASEKMRELEEKLSMLEFSI